MMIALLDAAQIERIVSFIADQKPEAIDIKGARAAKIADAQFDMACPHDIERRVENRFADRHGIKPALTVGPATFNTLRGGIDMRLASYHMRAGRASGRWSATELSICAPV